MLINVFSSSALTTPDRVALTDAISEIQSCLEENSLADDLKIRFYGKSQLTSNGMAFSTGICLGLAKSYRGMVSSRGETEWLIDGEDLVRVVKQKGPFDEQSNIVLLLVVSPIVIIGSDGKKYRKRCFSKDNVCVISTQPFQEERLVSSDRYRVVKLTVQREIGRMLGVLTNRWDNIFWRNGVVHCMEPLCVMNMAESTIQMMGLARKIDSAHVVYCRYCINSIRRNHGLSTNTQP